MGADGGNRVVRTICQECHNQCGMLVHVEDGRAVRVEAAPDSHGASAHFCERRTRASSASTLPTASSIPRNGSEREAKGSGSAFRGRKRSTR